MSTPSVKFHLLLPLLVALLTACATAAPSTTTSIKSSATQAVAPQQTKLLQTPQEQLEFHIMAGEMAAGRQQAGIAAQQFLDALQDAPDPQLAERATALALHANDDALALKISRKWLEIDPASSNAREVIVRLALRLQKQDLALQQCRKIIQIHQNHKAQGYRLVAQLLSQEPQHAAEATAVMDQLLTKDADYAPAHEAAALLALRFDQAPRAESEAREALQLDPSAQDASLLLVSALIRQDHLDDADKVMHDLYRGDTHVQALRLGYAQLLLQAHHTAHARIQLQQVLVAQPRNDDARFLLALIDLDDNQLDRAEQELKGISSHDKARSADVQYYLGRIAEARHQPETALRHYAKVDSGGQLINAVTRSAVLLGKLGRLDQAQDLLQQMSQTYPQMDDQFIVVDSQILVDADQAQRAADLLDRALQAQPDNADLLYSRALVYDHLGKTDQAESDLRAVLAQTPNDPRALNALGYMLTEHNPDKLDEAHSMIARALKQTPDDPAVMDSMGWVLYRQGHPDQALPLLRKAYMLFPDPEVAAHLVAVLNALGDSTQAQQVLTNALKDNPSNPALHKVSDQLKR